jgi:hypothetical protein
VPELLVLRRTAALPRVLFLPSLFEEIPSVHRLSPSLVFVEHLCRSIVLDTSHLAENFPHLYLKILITDVDQSVEEDNCSEACDG